MEDLRQSAAQSRAFGVDAAVAARLDGPVTALVLDLAVIGIILIPPLLASLLDLFRKPEDVLLGQHLVRRAALGGRHLAQAVFTLVCLPYEAFFSLDAIVRTIWRMLVTHTAAGMESVERSGSDTAAQTLLAFCRIDVVGPVLAAARGRSI